MPFLSPNQQHQSTEGTMAKTSSQKRRSSVTNELRELELSWEDVSAAVAEDRQGWCQWVAQRICIVDTRWINDKVETLCRKLAHAVNAALIVLSINRSSCRQPPHHSWRCWRPSWNGAECEPVADYSWTRRRRDSRTEDTTTTTSATYDHYVPTSPRSCHTPPSPSRTFTEHATTASVFAPLTSLRADVAINAEASTYRTRGGVHLPGGLSPWLARWCGTRWRTTWETRQSAETLSTSI